MKPKPTTDRHGNPVWTINVPKVVWGKRVRLFAPTAQEVQQKFNQMQRRALLGIDHIEFNDEDKKAKAELGDRGTLLQAVRAFLAMVPAKAEKSIGDAIVECVERKKELNRRPAYTRHLETILNHSSAFGDRSTKRL